MARPPEVRPNKWNQAVSRISAEMAWTSAQADTWLEAVWVNMRGVEGRVGDEVMGEVAANERLRAMLLEVAPPASTLPQAFYLWATT